MFTALVFSALAALGANVVSAADETISGYATCYQLDKPTSGHCNLLGGHPSNEMDMYVSLSASVWKQSNCNRCVAVNCADSRCSAALRNQTTYLHVLDSSLDVGEGPTFASGPVGSLDMSPIAFTKVTGVPSNRYKIQWHWAPCPFVQGPLEYCIKAGSQQWWGGVQVLNTKQQIVSVEANGLPAKIMDGAYFYIIDRGTKTIDYTKLTVTSTSASGEKVTETVSVQPGGCTKGTKQFTSTGATPVSNEANTSPAPTTAAPATTAPVTTAPVTTAPVTTAPATTAPVTTAPETTAPVTTAPATTAPTTAPETTAPAPEPTTAAPASTSKPKKCNAKH